MRPYQPRSDAATRRRQLAQQRNWAIFRVAGMLSHSYALYEYCNRRDVEKLRHILADIITRQIPQGYRRKLKALNKELSKDDRVRQQG